MPELTPARREPLTSGRREQLAAFYAARHRQLALAVHRRARRADATTVADACAYAWLTLVRRSDVTLGPRGFCWLALVATQEAWRLSAPRAEHPAGTFIPDPDHPEELPDPAGLADDPLDRVIALETHHERIERFAALKPRERRDLLLHAGGYRYHEIAALTDSTYTAVNRHLRDGRARLRARP